MRGEARVAGLALATALLLGATPARAHCRTMACPLPADFSPSEEACVPADFVSWCSSLDPPAAAIPVWWRSACVSYDLAQAASRQVPYAVADAMFAEAFAKWTTLDCASGAPGGSGRVSIDARDLGPVACDQVQYDQQGPNQHVILFHDDVWPYDDANNTLGLTTVTYDVDTGEIYDADMEINATVPLTLSDPVPAGGYDLQSIITHESGHFLGMAHSGDVEATMFAHYVQGSTTMRTLQDDDVAGLCSIYLPGGARVVATSVVPSGRVMEGPCDPTPQGGFTTACASPPSRSCAVTAASPEPPTTGGAMVLLAGAGSIVARRGGRRRGRRPS